MRKNFKYFLPLAITLVLLIVIELARPRPIDWTPSYSRDDKIPYGSFVLYDLLPRLFPQQSIAPIDATVYEVLEQLDDSVSNYIFINRTFEPDQYDTEKLLDFASNGGTIFVSAEDISGNFADTLGIETMYSFSSVADTVQFKFVNPALAATARLRQYGASSSFSVFDTTRATVLGMDTENNINFIRMPFGRGMLYLHTMPIMFTNYNILHKQNSEYVYAALSYLPVQRTLWDEYYKAGRTEIKHPLRYILNNRSLGWAWRVLLVALILFAIFEAKRKQRIIPIVAPPANATLEFVTMVGKLYYQHGDLRNIADKKITYVLEYIRSHLGVQTTEFNDEFIAAVAARSGIDPDKVRALFDIIRLVQSKQHIDDSQLSLLNERIEQFYSQSLR
jgi:hypothetical protein